ncbi:MAG: DUF2927 domain-containing protein [Sulfitobacter sp.]
MRVLLAAIWAVLFLGGAALAAPPTDYVETEGELSDRDFYRLVACAAPPGKPCARAMLRWRKRDISVGLVHVDRAFLGKKIKRAEASIERAVQQINGIDFPIRMRMVPNGQRADISVYLMDTPRKQVMRAPQVPEINGTWVGNASTRIMAKGQRITATQVIFSRDLGIGAYESVMLEELVQSLGLITDIKNPYYEKRSIFTQEGGNHRRNLSYKDRMSLRRHYE